MYNLLHRKKLCNFYIKKYSLKNTIRIGFACNVHTLLTIGIGRSCEKEKVMPTQLRSSSQRASPKPITGPSSRSNKIFNIQQFKSSESDYKIINRWWRKYLARKNFMVGKNDLYKTNQNIFVASCPRIIRHIWIKQYFQGHTKCIHYQDLDWKQQHLF